MILPQTVWIGLFDDYRNLVKDTTEAPDNYHFVNLASIFGAVLGRRIWFDYAVPTFPNYYTCDVGPTAIARKGTAWRLAEAILYEVDPTIKRTYPGSAEGLLDQLDGNRQNVAIAADELRSLLAKAHYQDGVKSLIPKIAELFDCLPVYQLGTRNNPVVANKPFVSMFAGTTIEWLNESLQMLDIHGGLGNRILFVPGEPKPPKPRPAKIDQVAKQKIVNELKDIQQWAEKHYNSTAEGEITATDAAYQMFEPYYLDNYEKCKEATSVESVLIRRLHVYVWKFALLYVAMDRSVVIDTKHLQPAIEVCAALEGGVREVFSAFSETKTGQVEKKILEILKTKRNINFRELYRKLNIPSGQLWQICENMTKGGLITMKEVKGRGRAGWGIRLLS